VKGNNVLVQVLSASLNPADYKVPEMGLVARKLVIGTPVLAQRAKLAGPAETAKHELAG
jgi:hypothetical protein